MHRSASTSKARSSKSTRTAPKQSKKRLQTTTKIKPTKTKSPHSSQNKLFSTHNDDNDFEFDELPTVKPTTSRTSTINKLHATKPTQSTIPSPGGDFLKSGSPTILSEEISGTGTMGVQSDGTVRRKTAKQPQFSFAPDASVSLHEPTIFDTHGTPQKIDPIIAVDPKFTQLMERKTALTPLSNEMRQQIVLRGPLSIAEYMQFCLGHPQFGYYMQRNAIGKKGDFVTSPEISPLFSEMVGIWGVSTWMRMGRPQTIQIVELGPGRGTLMKDFLATAERFPDFYNALSIHFVENSGAMRKLQRQALGVDLDLEVMKFHPNNAEIDLATHDLVDGAGEAIIMSDDNINASGNQGQHKISTRTSMDGMTSDEFQQKQDTIASSISTLLEKSSSLRSEIMENIHQLQGDKQSPIDLPNVAISELRPELLVRLKQLETDFASKVNDANELVGLQGSIETFNVTMEKHLNQQNNDTKQTSLSSGNSYNDLKHSKEQFLDSFMKLSTGHFTPSDFHKIFDNQQEHNSQDGKSSSTLLRTLHKNTNGDLPNADEFDDENGWIWSDQPTTATAERIAVLQNEENDLQGQLLLSLPRVTLPSYMSPEQQQIKLQHHQESIAKQLQDDPEFNKRITAITTRIAQVAEELSNLKDTMYDTKVYNKKAHKYNKYMASPVVCGLTDIKFDPQRSGNHNPSHDSKKSSIHLNETDVDHSAKDIIKKMGIQKDKLKKQLPVSWHWTLLDVPSTAPCIILAHEFFDALPVHQFQFTQRGWREILVDADESLEGDHHFKYVLSPTPTPASVSFLQPSLLQPQFDGTGIPQPLLQHNDGHQHKTESSTLDRQAQASLQTAGSAQAAVQRAAKLATQAQAELDAKKATKGPTSDKNVLLGSDGLPLNQPTKRVIDQQIQFKSLSESLSTLSNPLVSPDDVKNISNFQETSTIIGLDNNRIGSTKVGSVQDEQLIRDLDARFKRQGATTHQLAIKTDSDKPGYNQMHGIDRAFEAELEQSGTADNQQITDTSAGVLQNSPFIRDKLKSSNKIGDTFEASPASLMWSEQIALRLMKNGGAALLIDYGDNDLGHLTPKDYESDAINAYGVNTSRGHAFRQLSLQGIKAHQHTDVLQEPGLVDLSAHVNFAALGAAMKKTEQLTNLLLQRPQGTPDHTRALEMLKLSPSGDLDASTFTPRKLNVTRAITQGALLQQLGMEDRFAKLLKNCHTEQEQVSLFESINRLVEPQQMGELFKAMTVYTDMQRPPVGWDGHIVRKEYDAHAHYDDKQRIKQIAEERAEIEQQEAEYMARNKMLNKMNRDSNTYKIKQELEYETRLRKAAAEAGTDSTFNASLIGGSEVNELSSINSPQVSDASRALEELQKTRDAEINRGYYVVDRSKYGMD